ncbi:MAG TPA: ribonuclease PH [Deltaproteobacteria bacterium]|nr:ribonuclease PH [Deltaproteobacteria bacterium]
MKYIRSDKRNPNQLRPIKMVPHYTRYAEGSVLIKQGHTVVLCNASVEEDVPRHVKGSGKGWVTAEYAMLPRATHTRSSRESVKGKVQGRTQEISRLVGRALRSVCDMSLLGERQITVDCDVLQADGGTRCASITGGYVALAMACTKLVKQGAIPSSPLTGMVAAVSTGIVSGVSCLDLNYEEDSAAEVDMNFVVTDAGLFVEVQGTAEHNPFSFTNLQIMKNLAMKGIRQIIIEQKKILKKP